jgi:hypothetical protein
MKHWRVDDPAADPGDDRGDLANTERGRRWLIPVNN